jgi:hypothetical protein
VVSRVGFRGYVLEEVLAFLIRNAGYRLLVVPRKESNWRTVVTGWSSSAEVGLIKSMCWASYRGFPRLRFPSGCSLRRNSMADTLFERGRDVEHPVRTMRLLVRRELGTWPDGIGPGLYETDVSWVLLMAR